MNSRRDQRIADEAGEERTLHCAAVGCPNRWAVDAGKGRLCSWHAWASPHEWPAITAEQRSAETDRALALQDGSSGERPAFVTRNEALAKLARVRPGQDYAPPQPGQGMTQTQLEMLREIHAHNAQRGRHATAAD